MKTIGMKRPTGPIDEAGDSVLFGLFQLLTAWHVEPFCRGFCPFELEATGVQDSRQRDSTSFCLKHNGFGIHLLKDAMQTISFDF